MLLRPAKDTECLMDSCCFDLVSNWFVDVDKVIEEVSDDMGLTLKEKQRKTIKGICLLRPWLRQRCFCFFTYWVAMENGKITYFAALIYFLCKFNKKKEPKSNSS